MSDCPRAMNVRPEVEQRELRQFVLKLVVSVLLVVFFVLLLKEMIRVDCNMLFETGQRIYPRC